LCKYFGSNDKVICSQWFIDCYSPSTPMAGTNKVMWMDFTFNKGFCLLRKPSLASDQWLNFNIIIVKPFLASEQWLNFIIIIVKPFLASEQWLNFIITIVIRLDPYTNPFFMSNILFLLMTWDGDNAKVIILKKIKMWYNLYKIIKILKRGMEYIFEKWIM